MSQPVKLSDTLVLDARIAGEAQERSIARQVEYWAKIGKLVDALLDGRSRTRALERSEGRSLSELMTTVGTPEGDARLKAYLASEPYPHFEAHLTMKGLLIRIEKDGTRMVGRFVDRKFVMEPEHGSKDPWEEAEREYPVGSQLEGRVTKTMTSWALVQVGEGIEGLVHVSEISEIIEGQRIRDVSKVLRVGDIVKVNVLAVDASKHQIKLSMKQVGARPEFVTDLKSKVRGKRQVTLAERTR